MNKQEIVSRIATRASQDAAYKQELFNNPKAALAKEGINIPANIQVTVFQETSTSLVLVLPMNPNPQELAESELESVSGGAAAAQGIDISWD
jgi:predicted secreted protein